MSKRMAEQVDLGDAALASGNIQGAEAYFREAFTKGRRPDSTGSSYDLGRARHGLAKCFIAQSRYLQQACQLSESVLAIPITGDQDRRLILDAAYTLAIAYLMTGSLTKARGICRLVIEGNRKFSDGTYPMHMAMALMVKILEADHDYKQAKSYAKLLPNGFEAPLIGTIEHGSHHDSMPPTDIDESMSTIWADGSASQSLGTKPVGYYDPNMTNAYDPSLTKLLLKPFSRKPGPDPAWNITSLTDLRNPNNPLSPHYTSFVTLPVAVKDLTPQPSVAATSPGDVLQPGQAQSSGSKFFKRAKSAGSAFKSFGYPGDNDRFRYVRMSRDEYTRYWARDTSGNYIGTEPEGLGIGRVRDRWLQGGGKSISQLEYVGHITEGRDPFASA